ncbi:hypothetical protein OCAE111667_19830 [Occultella aeris]|uniref:Uncharacterized protein n=1 Tax=Occultella aeris TaxID=2761496 RepID=A0A7M4DJL9_9MICO|nr:hypothetical protein [Occultella aeris]VZO37239.1 hypothetical protein HALOF300_02326 [Occultella aeris]
MQAIWDNDHVLLDQRIVADVDRSFWSERARVVIEGVPWEYGKDGSERVGTIVGEPAARCRAVRPSFWRQNWVIAIGPTTRYEIAPEGAFRRSYVVTRDGQWVGSSGVGGFWSIKPTLDIADDVPVADAVFLLWIAFLMRARANQAASQAG